MPKTIKVELSKKSINKAIKEVQQYADWVGRKEDELRSRLAFIGATVASIRFSGAIYSGTNDISVRVYDMGKTAVIFAEGESVAFIEFGAGAKYGYGHPEAGKFGFGPGTYPSDKGNWDNKNGWWYAHGQHTYGNPPAMAMYQAVQTMTEQLTKIAREVFATA